MKRGIVGFIFISFFLFLKACNTTDPPIDKAELTLTLEDVSCTEAWITLTTTNLQLPATITLKQTNPTGDTKSQILNLNTKDSVLYVDSLLPNKIYQYQASNIQNPASSNELNVTTMDTTSHDFNFESFLFGEHGNSVLFDVAIVGDEVWAVGEIYMNDSLGNPDPTRYNAIIWNGESWTVLRIPYYYQGQPFYNPTQSVYAFEQNDIWFCGNGVIHWDGNSFIPKPIPTNVWGPYQINKIWGSSSNDLYVVGNNGNIARYNGSQWTKIESGTDVDLLDVWGSPDGTAWTCGYTNDYAITVLLRYDGNVCNKVYEGSPNNQNNNEYIGPTSGVWANSEFFTYVASWGKVYRQPNNNILNIKRITPNFSDVAFAIRGTEHNNIFITGQHGLVGHFNGVTYQEITALENQDEYLLKIDVKNSTAVAVGYNYQGITGSTAVVHIINKN